MTVFLYTFTEREKIYNLVRAAHRRALHHQLHPRRRPDARSAGRLHPDCCAKFLDEVARASSTRWTACSRATASSSIARRTSASITKEDAIAYGLTRPEPARLRRRSRSAQEAPVSRLRAVRLRRADRLRRRLLRPLPRPHGGNAPVRSASCIRSSTRCPAARST